MQNCSLSCKPEILWVAILALLKPVTMSASVLFIPFKLVEFTSGCIGVTASGIEKVLAVKGINCHLGLILLSQGFVVAVA